MARDDGILGEPPPKIKPNDIIERGDAIYERDIRHLVEPQHNGKFAVIDVYSGDYEIAWRDGEATHKLLKRHPNAMTALVKIGSPGPIPWPRMKAVKLD